VELVQSKTSQRTFCTQSHDLLGVVARDTLQAYRTRKCKMSTLFDGHYLRNRSTLDIGVLGYIGIV